MEKIKKLTRTIPPKSGPMPQGLSLSYNTVKQVGTEKINGRQRRQGVTKRRTRIMYLTMHMYQTQLN